ncbi:hypothetical protein [Roseateles koreensis]|uniref:Uncharacterized protein n=1 Tax=Roseateles koreensis TaxID=2987526 RepID=A0ABT5KUI8_9BURK|nr:hypothetical protein [Roseateles koreensis]MDC8786100.1 hypothetical protein [Roseateles koreensis]
MRLIFTLMVILGLTSPQAHPAQPFGHYTSIVWDKSDDPHAEGYAVILHQENSVIFGDFLYAPGSIDITRSKLFDLKIEKNRIEFKTKASCCREFSKETEIDGRPSRDYFIFQGIFKNNHLIGSLEHRNGYQPEAHVKPEIIKLRRTSESGDLMSFKRWQNSSPPPADW